MNISLTKEENELIKKLAKEEDGYADYSKKKNAEDKRNIATLKRQL